MEQKQKDNKDQIPWKRRNKAEMQKSDKWKPKNTYTLFWHWQLEIFNNDKS